MAELNAKNAKIIAMVGLGLGSFVVGMLPAWLYRRSATDNRGTLLRSTLLCFGGGVLLATALIHMLPEAKETLPEYADVSFCAGFFLIYFVDELVHLFYGRGAEDFSDNQPHAESGHSHGHSHVHNHSEAQHRSQTYGSTETSALLVGAEPVATGCHGVEREPCTESSAGRGGLLLALSTHATLEGLAIGLQDVPSKVLLLLGAVASHKFVVGFCLGTELTASATITLCKHIIAIAIFSLGSVCGIGIGMIIEGTDEYWTQTVLGVMQALAGGTLLYVTLSEVLPRERARWHNGSRVAGMIQFSSVVIGFLVMYFINKYLDAD